jgi:hypothetical protein
VTSRELKFSVDSVSYFQVLPAEALCSGEFEVHDEDLIKGSLTEINQWGKSLPRRFAMQVAFPVSVPIPERASLEMLYA